MTISARNLFTGKISAIRASALNAQVILTTNTRQNIVATITSGSLREMQLEVGKTVQAYIKAPWIMLHKGEAPISSSARNQLPGTIQAMTLGAVNILVHVVLNDGSLMQCTVTKGAMRKLELAEGDKVCLLFKASHVVLGVRTASI